MEKSNEYKVLSVVSFQPVTGWWYEENLEPMDDEEVKQTNFHPLFGVATVRVTAFDGRELKLSLIVTLAELKQLNYNALTGEGSIAINRQNRIYRHDVDFEAKKESSKMQLKDDAEDRDQL
jgi:hypothetical protein